jgi:hypothetical protein
MDEIRRLWRLRKLHHLVDAEIRDLGDACELRFVYNGEVAYSGREKTFAAAAEKAGRKRAELERAGWISHW